MADKKEKIRVIGYMARLQGEPQVGPWKPLSRSAVDAMPPLPKRAERGWEVQKPASEGAEKDRRHSPTAQPAEEGERAVETPAPEASRTPLPLPADVEKDSLRAQVWEHPEDAAKTVRTMFMEDRDEEGHGDMPPLQQVAILCVGLGQEVAAEILKHLSDYEIEEITQAIAGLKNTPTEVVAQVLEEFKQHLLAGEWVAQGGIDFARGMLERVVGPRRAQEVIQRVTAKTSSGFYMLKNVAPDQIAPFISHEHPQTIALILSQLEPAQSSGILAQLSERLQADVSYRIATMENITPHVIKQIEESLEASLRDILSGNQDVGGPKVVADMLNLTGSSVEKNVLDQIDAQDPEFAETVRNLMFVFEDIAKFSDYEIQVLLKEVSEKHLTIALKAASDNLKDKILGNISAEARQKLTEEMEFLGPMRLSEVEEVQLLIVQQVRQLEEQGKLTIIRGDSDNAFV